MRESDVHVPSNADWPRTRPVPLTAPLHWLGRGFADLLERPDSWMFALAYASVGALLAAFSFASSAVALPLLLDRASMDAISAMIVSLSVIRANPAPLLLWAVLIVVLCVAGFVTWFVGLVFTVPLIGHATWHAYRDCVEPLADIA